MKVTSENASGLMLAPRASGSDAGVTLRRRIAVYHDAVSQQVDDPQIGDAVQSVHQCLLTQVEAKRTVRNFDSEKEVGARRVSETVCSTCGRRPPQECQVRFWMGTIREINRTLHSDPDARTKPFPE